MLTSVGWRSKSGEEELQDALVGPRIFGNLQADDIPYEEISIVYTGQRMLSSVYSQNRLRIKRSSHLLRQGTHSQSIRSTSRRVFLVRLWLATLGSMNGFYWLRHHSSLSRKCCSLSDRSDGSRRRVSLVAWRQLPRVL